MSMRHKKNGISRYIFHPGSIHPIKCSRCAYLATKQHQNSDFPKTSLEYRPAA